MASYDDTPTGKPAGETSSLAARRARLRGSLAKQALPPDPYKPDPYMLAEANKANQSDSNKPKSATPSEASKSVTPIGVGEEDMSPGAQRDPWPNTLSQPLPPIGSSGDGQSKTKRAADENPIQLKSAAKGQSKTGASQARKDNQPVQSPSDETGVAPKPVLGLRAISDTTTAAQNSLPPQMQVIELLNNMDQALGACATNLAALQKLAGEQSEAIKGLAENLQTRTLSELGLSLTSVMESLSGALEPMKAVGELVPAIDQLVACLEAKTQTEESFTRPSPDQLVTNLADQLGMGTIDPWTFKSAYMAVFPEDHPADLLHRLVDLLGTQRLSGELFRAAYEAVQTEEPTGKPLTTSRLPRTNKQAAAPQSQSEAGTGLKEKEFQEKITLKEKELQEAQEALNSRWEEFNNRYDELNESVQRRDDLLAEKEAELSRKESENALLRAQMEELREETQGMVANLQKQFTSGKAEANKAKSTSFFDVAPSANQNAAGAETSKSAPPKTDNEAPRAEPAKQGNPVAVRASVAGLPGMPQTAPISSEPTGSAPSQGSSTHESESPPAPPAPQASPISAQAIPRANAQVASNFPSGPGSYGSGVRAQVFEVIVRQALAGAPWREICAGPMQVNNISAEEVETEVKRRQDLLKK